MRYGARRGSSERRLTGVHIAAIAGLVAGLVAPCAAPPAEAQLRISGQVDALARAGSDYRDANTNFRGDSPFNSMRARLFAQRWLTDEIGVFAEVLFDRESGPRLNGAYVVVNEIGGLDWLNARAGLAPSPIGSFGMRSTYFNSNPLIGVPLVWQHRTTLDGSGLATAADLIRRRGSNETYLPMLYDACWNVQWELMGEVGKMEYSLALTNGSMSNPLGSDEEDGVQALARLGYEPMLGLRLGVSGGYGPYIGGAYHDPLLVVPPYYEVSPWDHVQRLVGLDAEYAIGKTHFWAEGYTSTWEAPLVAEDLTATGGYVEGRYDFLPAWFAAARIGALVFSEIEAPAGGTTGWDDDVLRFESTLTYRWARELHLRAGWQHSLFLTGPDEPIDLFSLQLRAVF
jgi:hypothetical protein